MEIDYKQCTLVDTQKLQEQKIFNSVGCLY